MMSARSAPGLEELRKLRNRIKNVVVFISDSLRWDYLPAEIRELGLTFKGIASSIFTASSVPSIVTGLYPNNHEIYSFLDKLPNYVPSLFSIPKINKSIWCENTWTEWKPEGYSQIHEILNFRDPKPLECLEPPFIYLEDEKGGHCPYGWTEDDVYKESDCLSFFSDYGKRSLEELRARYKKGVKRSVRMFMKRLKTLEKKGIADETLVIFLSDHGELLGEYGLVGHGNITLPQLVYVPIVFIHPDLPTVDASTYGVVRHVDIFPTIVDLLGFDSSILRIDGESLVRRNTLPQIGKSYYRFQHGAKYLEERGIWDNSGGYVFREGSLRARISRVLLYTLGSFLGYESVEGIYLKSKLRSRPLEAIKNYAEVFEIGLRRELRFGNPHMEIDEARRLKLKDIEMDSRYAVKVKLHFLRKKIGKKKNL